MVTNVWCCTSHSMVLYHLEEVCQVQDGLIDFSPSVSTVAMENDSFSRFLSHPHSPSCTFIQSFIVQCHVGLDSSVSAVAFNMSLNCELLSNSVNHDHFEMVWEMVLTCCHS